jgi:hypothetical protein
MMMSQCGNFCFSSQSAIDFEQKRAAKHEQLFCMSSERSCLELGPSTALCASTRSEKKIDHGPAIARAGLFVGHDALAASKASFDSPKKKADLSATK